MTEQEIIQENAKLQGRLQKWVCFTREEEGKGYLHTIDADIIDQHLTLYEVFLRTWIDYRGQRICNQFRI